MRAQTNARACKCPQEKNIPANCVFLPLKQQIRTNSTVICTSDIIHKINLLVFRRPFRPQSLRLIHKRTLHVPMCLSAILLQMKFSGLGLPLWHHIRLECIILCPYIKDLYASLTHQLSPWLVTHFLRRLFKALWPLLWDMTPSIKHILLQMPCLPFHWVSTLVRHPTLCI